jgi:peptide chain release factor 3
VFHSLVHELAEPRTADAAIAQEAARRRTFAIISHPDAGKTTLTEKLLLYSGAIELAGAVRHKAQQRHVRSDWMEVERARGISVTSTVLQFDHAGLRFNLLDTPGHQDFSEDTYRVLTAVDSAVMVLDAAKGVEPQTIKLFDVCRQRELPVLTFVNKLDQAGRDPLELLDEIEQVLGMDPVPVNWPIGSGPEFVGVYELETRRVLRFEKVSRGERAAPVRVSGIDDPDLAHLVGASLHDRLREEIELLAAAGHRHDSEAFATGRQTPVFFGSALNNFGVAPFLEALGRWGAPPSGRESDAGWIDPASEVFSGFVFKIQANMDPQHRDSMAFLRVVSGRFEKGMSVEHPRLGKRVRLPRAHRIFAQDRETTEEAFPGDVVGLVNPGLFVIGDTVSDGAALEFAALPRFAPEHFARLRPATVDQAKGFRKGLAQLEEEGAIQVFYEADAARREPILAAVGELQFDLVQSRLAAEYRVETKLDRLTYRSMLRVLDPGVRPEELTWPMRGAVAARDRERRTVGLFEGPWAEDLFRDKNPGVALARTL